MQKPTKAFAEMMSETADKVEAVLTELYPAGGAQDEIAVSAAWLRQKATEIREGSDRDFVADTLTAFLSNYRYREPVSSIGNQSARAEAVALLEKFDIKPKVGQG